MSTAWLLTQEHNLMFDEDNGTSPPVSATYPTCVYYKYTNGGLRLQGVSATASAQDLAFPGQSTKSSFATGVSEPSIQSTFDGLRIKFEQNVPALNMGFKSTVSRLHNGGSFASWDDLNDLVTIPAPDSIFATGLPHTVSHSVPRGRMTQHYLPMSCNDAVYHNRCFDSTSASAPGNSDNFYGHMMKAAQANSVTGGTSFAGTPAALDLCVLIEPYDTTISNNFTFTLLARYFAKQFRLDGPNQTVNATPHKPFTGVSPSDPTRAANQSMIKAKTAQKHASGESTGIDKAEDLAEGGAALVGGGTIAKGLVGTAEKGLTSVVTSIEEVGGEAAGLIGDAAPLLLGL
jgi:hypothetical protein